MKATTGHKIVFLCGLPNPSEFTATLPLRVTWYLDGGLVKSEDIKVQDLPSKLNENDWSPNGTVSLGKNVNKYG